MVQITLDWISGDSW